MSLKLWLAAAALSLAGLTGCTENAPSPSSAAAAAPLAKKAHAECLVCKHENDLACVDLDVDATTPTVVKDGKTYYFCSDECKREFEKNPDKFTKGK
jgi:YHS domain-containing protein